MRDHIKLSISKWHWTPYKLGTQSIMCRFHIHYETLGESYISAMWIRDSEPTRWCATMRSYPIRIIFWQLFGWHVRCSSLTIKVLTWFYITWCTAGRSSEINIWRFFFFSFFFFGTNERKHVLEFSKPTFMCQWNCTLVLTCLFDFHDTSR